MNKLAPIILAVALFSVMPSLAEITCEESVTFDVKEGDRVVLRANITQEDLSKVTIEWNSDTAIVLNETDTKYVEFIAPAVSGSECVVYNVSTYVTTNLLGENPGECVDEDCIKFRVCPQTCTPNPIEDACWTDFTDTNLWDNNTYKGTVTHNWTIYEITSPTPATPMTTITYTDKNATLLKATIDTNGKPTKDIPKRCFRVEYTVKSSSTPPQTILSCFTPPEEFCLVYDPEVVIDKIAP